MTELFIRSQHNWARMLLKHSLFNKLKDKVVSNQPPNIVLIMTDQQRFDTIKAWGAEHMITPNMDALASRSVAFKQAYCPGATCVASRAAIFTGMYAHNTGAYTFDNWAHQRNWVQDLAEAGYWCANIGKMHFEPMQHRGGFHERVIVENPTMVVPAQGGADDDWGYHLKRNGIERPVDRHKTDPQWMDYLQAVPWHHEPQYHSDIFIKDSAVGWIKDYRGTKPFFLQIGFTGPHEPWDALPRHLDLYRAVEPPQPIWREGELADNPPQHTAIRDFHASADHESRIDLQGASKEQIDNMRRAYYAKITLVDECLGEVMSALEARDLLNNSYIIFCSDHGEMLGDHHMVYKWLMYDCITHVPLMIAPPASISATNDVPDLVSLIDIGPTVLDIAGVDCPTYLEGRSLRPYLENGSVETRDYVFSEDNYLTMIRSQTHKLIYYTGQEDIGELYDLQADPNELHNQWDNPNYQSVRQELTLALLKWLARSTYHTAGYKQGERHYQRRFPTPEDSNLHGIPAATPPQNMG